MPPASRNARKRQQTRDHIAQVAFELFETHGFDAVTMDQIATTADVARGTLYNHFPVKEAVLAHAMHDQLRHDLTPLLHDVMQRSCFTSRVAGLLEASADWWEGRRRYLAPYLRHRFQHLDREPRGDEAPTSDMVTAYAALIERGQHDGELRGDLPAMRLALYLHFLYLSALIRWLPEPELSLADELAGALEFFNSGAMARAG